MKALQVLPRSGTPPPFSTVSLDRSFRNIYGIFLLKDTTLVPHSNHEDAGHKTSTPEIVGRTPVKGWMRSPPHRRRLRALHWSQ
eukprot:1479048-Pyramimonas_sp.AAC.1